MKKLLAATVIITALFAVQNAKAQDDGTGIMGINLSVGYKHLPCINIPNSYDAFSFEFTAHHHALNVDFNSSISYGKDYLSYEPFPIIGIICLFIANTEHGDELRNNPYFSAFVAASVLSGVGFNIKFGDNFKLRPYYSLLRVSKIKNVTDKTTLNAGVGTYFTVDLGRFMISPFCEYGFGYVKNSPFTGVNYGISLGVKLFEY
ncbi:MAG: hypothetical protein LBT27_07485 [Prevotellaceae bacterium]|jgi:hypothetical protein|nr:hypothetical protein [Prevotellaceae bacterium]